MNRADLPIPPKTLEKWQGLVDLLAEIIGVPAALLTKVEPPEIVFCLSSRSAGNPFAPGEGVPFDAGSYGETVIRTRTRLLLPDARGDETWASSPELRRGMVSYLGLPLLWPNQEVFGTICVLDHQRNPYSALHQRLIQQFRDEIEADLHHLAQFSAYLQEQQQLAGGLRRAMKETRHLLDEAERSRQALLGILEDQKQAEEALRRREEHFRLLIENASDIITILNADATVRYQSPSIERLLGYTPEALVGKEVFAYIHPADLPQVREIFAAMLQNPGIARSVEFRFRHRDGSWRTLESIGKALRDETGVAYAVINSRDTTERKQAEEALRQSEAQFRAMNDASPLGIYLGDAEGDCLYLNRTLEQISGVTSQEALGKRWSQAVHPEDRDRVFAAWYTAVQGQTTYENLYRLLRRDGKTVWVSVKGSPVRDDRTLFGYVGIVEEITERKQAEEALQQQLMRISLLNQITRGIAERQDLESIFRTVLRRLEDHLPADLSGIRLFDPQADTLTVTAHGPKAQALAAGLGMPEGSVIPVHQTGLRACTQGQAIYIPDMAQVDKPIAQRVAGVGIRSLVATPLAVEDRVLGILVVGRCAADSFSNAECEFLQMLSEHVALGAYNAQLHASLQQAYDELRQTQQAIMQQERLRALGQMASGIAHDINNVLSPIVGFSDLLLIHESDLSQRAKRYLGMIKTAGTDIAQIVSRMREFYRKREGSEKLSPIDLNRLAQQVLELTRPRWRDIPQERGILIEMKADLHPDLPPVMGVEGEIREAITNLLFNAVDALPSSGTVTICTRMDRGTGEPPEGKASVHVLLEVSDTGVGMDEETRKRCLEPFFSTKGELGTGLGLAMVYGVMQRHEGEIEIESQVGQGTTMRLAFPTRGPARAGALADLETALPRFPLRVLCIDDEPLLRELIKEMVESGGHNAEVAEGGQAGLNAFRAAHERGEPFDVVITDLGMPHVDGRIVARAIKRESPSTPVVMLTGWGTRLHAEGDWPMEADAVLSKPPKLKEMREVLAKVAPAKV